MSLTVAVRDGKGGHDTSDRRSARGRQTQHDRALVWRQVVAERGSGKPWREIAETVQLCERQCRRIYRAYHRSEPTLDPITLSREIEESIRFYDAAIEDLAVVAENATGSYAKVRGNLGRRPRAIRPSAEQQHRELQTRVRPQIHANDRHPHGRQLRDLQENP
jgi:hypothetical protein